MRNCKYLLFILVMIPFVALSQDFPYSRVVKKSIVDSSDKVFLKSVLRKFCVPDVGFGYGLTTSDIATYKGAVLPSKPSDFKDVEKLRRQLDTVKQPVDRANYYLSIGQMLKRLNRRSLAFANFDSAYQILLPELKANPKDSSNLLTVSNIMMSADRFEEAIIYFDKFRGINKECDAFGSYFIPMLYLNIGKYAEASNFLDDCLRKWPEKEVGLYYDLMLQVSSFTQLASYRSEFMKTDRFKNYLPDSIFDLSRFQKLCKKYPDSIKWEQFYKGAMLLGLFFKKFAQTDDTLSNKEKVFALSSAEKVFLEQLRKDFKRILKSPHNHNPYLALKSLGTIEFFKMNFKESKKYFKKAIKKKKLSQSDFNSNASEVYDDLIGCYLFMGDTAKAQKILIEKIKKQPAIDPLANDYFELAEYYMLYNHMELARANYNKAIATDSMFNKAFIGLAVCDILEGQLGNAIKQVNIATTINKEYGFAYLVNGIAALLNNQIPSAYYMLKVAHKQGIEKDTIFEILDRFYEKEEY